MEPRTTSQEKPTPRTGFIRVWKAFFYSMDGLSCALRSEAAFRQECALFLVLLPVLWFLPLPLTWKAILLLANSAVLIVELLNSAVEAVVNLASPEYHLLAKQAKDLGSAAVLASLVLAAVLWAMALLSLPGGTA